MHSADSVEQLSSFHKCINFRYLIIIHETIYCKRTHKFIDLVNKTLH